MGDCVAQAAQIVSVELVVVELVFLIETLDAVHVVAVAGVDVGVRVGLVFCAPIEVD